MQTDNIAQGVVHDVPDDLIAVLLADPELHEKWNQLTPLARNEWICWTISVKKADTRLRHIERMTEELKEGKRRPCCWPGCPHR
ncbi:YdeI/OmpD-associated family protein [Spirochaeta dissipatitropha]